MKNTSPNIKRSRQRQKVQQQTRNRIYKLWLAEVLPFIFQTTIMRLQYITLTTCRTKRSSSGCFILLPLPQHWLAGPRLSGLNIGFQWASSQTEAPNSPLLHTHCVQSRLSPPTRFTGETTVIGRITGSDEAAYRRWPVWCHGVRTTTSPSTQTRSETERKWKCINIYSDCCGWSCQNRKKYELSKNICFCKLAGCSCR